MPVTGKILEKYSEGTMDRIEKLMLVMPWGYGAYGVSFQLRPLLCLCLAHRIQGGAELFPDSTYCSGTPDSGMDSSFLEGCDIPTPMSSQSSNQQARCQSAALPMYTHDMLSPSANFSKAACEELELWQGLVHLLMLASSISIVLQQSEYTV